MQPAIVWDWQRALLGAVCAIPAAIVALTGDVTSGLALAVGVLPAVVVGLAPRRRDRVRIVLLGALTGVPMWLGAALASVPVVAVIVIVMVGVGSVWLSQRRTVGQLVMTLSLPMIGIGLSFDDATTGLETAALITGGSVFAFLVSLLWPEEREPAAATDSARPATATLGYGLRLGAAGATAAAIGFALDLDHVGWACAAALLVMRPSAEMQRLRSAGRVISVVVGALTAAVLAVISVAPEIYCVAIVLALAAAAATHASRWYVTPAFSTFFAISLLVYASPADAQSRFNERVVETALGVALAYLYGLALPALEAKLRRARTS